MSHDRGFPATTDPATDFAEIPFHLNPGDQITDCSGLWTPSDRMAAELAKCQGCGRPTFRVITICSAAMLERRAALCGRHFINTARVFPELRKVRSAPKGSEC
jgi:hypothetical protein